MTVYNRSSEEIIKKAELAYSLDMIDEDELNNVVKSAQTVPGYTAILALPLDSEIEHELALRRENGRWGCFWKIWNAIFLA